MCSSDLAVQLAAFLLVSAEALLPLFVGMDEIAELGFEVPNLGRERVNPGSEFGNSQVNLLELDRRLEIRMHSR